MSKSGGIAITKIPTTKVVLLGDAGVGKTTLRQAYMGRGYRETYIPTIGADISIKDVEIGGKQLKYQIWDLAGHTRFDAVRSMYYSGSEGAILVYEITEPKSLDNLRNWIKELFVNTRKKKIPLLIIGNKIDLRPTHPCLSIEQGLEFVEKLREGFGSFIPIYFVETSAKTGKNVDDAFQKLGKTILSNFLEGRKKQLDC
ncbi:MAG: Rab family GTPase [Candidatus Hermodarchaeota archaeon]